MKDEGVSSVVAAVLIFALFSTAFLLWTFNTMPEWVADREHDQLQGVQSDFAGLQASLEGLSGSGQSGPVSSTISLAASPIPLLQQTENQGALKLGSAFFMNATFPNNDVALFSIDGQGVGAPSKGTTGTHASIAQIRVLELMLDPADSEDDQMTIVATGTSGPAATLTFEHEGEACLRVNVAQGATSRDTLVACGVAKDAVGKSINALAPEYGFKSALGQLTGPISITVTPGDGTYAATWIDSDGRPGVAGVGVVSSLYAPKVAGNALVFSSNAQQFPAQDIHWEGGGVLAKQGTQSSMVRSPSFLISEANGIGYLSWTIVELTGKGSVSGSGQSTAAVSHAATETILLSTTAANFAVSSSVARAWDQFFDDEIDLSETGSAAVTGTTAPTLVLNTATVSQWIIELRIIHATVEIN